MSTIPGTGLQTGEFLLYQTEDEQTRVQVRLTDGTLWLTQKQLADLYQVSGTSTRTVSLRRIELFGNSE